MLVLQAAPPGGDIRLLAETAKPSEEARAIMDGDPRVRARMILCEVHACHGYPGDALPA
jgi:hypothetical protein